MEATGLFLLKSAAWLTGFALVYLLVLRNERYFQLNRIYLLSGIVASLLFPFYTFHYTIVIPSLPLVSASMGELEVGEIVAIEPSIPFYYWIYLAGILTFLLRLLFQTWKIIRKLQKAGYERTGDVKLVRTSDYASSFSFFSFVFVNPSTSAHEMKEIMNHEREHIRQRHWFDLLLVELICIVQWFNPFAWVYAHLVRQNHEYLADEHALQRTVDPAIYQAALLNQLLGAPVFSLTNSFSYSLNKKRFKMMKKKIDSPFRKLKMLVVLPLAAMLFYAFAVPEYQYFNSDNSVEQQGKTVDVKGQVVKSDGTPLAGTSVILKASTIGTITDQEGNFQLKGIPADGEIYFSFVGFQTKVQKVSGEPMKVVMEVGKVGIEAVTVVGYGTPPPPPPPPFNLEKELEGPNPPLILLDGVEITKEAAIQLNPNQIKGKGITKNKSAVTLYGEKAKNGVLFIFTKEKSGNEKVAKFLIDDANPPLILLDEVPVSKADMDKIDPETIFAMNVLKDKSATALFGEKAKNGVILLTTKAHANLNQNLGKKQDTVRFDKNNPPLYFVDNVLIEPKDIGQTKPDMIDHIDILQEKRATELYGEKGKNGAVFIYTKAKTSSQEGKGVPYSTEQISTQDGMNVFVVVEEMPEFPGGEKALRDFIGSNVKYPDDAKKEGIQGKVYVTFVVKTDGTVANAKVVRGVHQLLDNEALRVISLLPTWKPGKQRGQVVNVAYTIPIQFALDGDKMAKQNLILPSSPKVPTQRPDGVYIVVEEMPEFPGGELALRDFMAHAIKYPAEAVKDSIQGKVFVTFVVNADGTVGETKVARGVHPLLDNEAVRVVKALPTWKPGKQKGEAVPVSYTVPVKFALDGGKKKETVSFVPPKINEKGEKEVFVVVEEMPEFPGGSLELRKFIAKEVRYPTQAVMDKAQGKVFVSFVVNSQGKIEKAKIERSVTPALDAEALRVVNLMPDWKPGKQRGQAVSVEYTVPIEFKLQ